MTDQNTDSAVATQAPSASSRPLSTDSFFSQLEASFNDHVEGVDHVDGSTVLRMRSSEPAVESSSEPAESPEEPSAADTPVAQSQADSPDGGWEARYKEIQSFATRTSQENAELRERLARIEGRLEGSAPAEESEDDADTLDPEMADSLRSFLSKNLKGLLQETLGVDPEIFSPMANEYGYMKEVRETAAQKEDFSEVLPDILSLYERFPSADITVSQAYDIVKAFRQQTPQQTPPPPAAPTSAPSAPAPPQAVTPTQPAPGRPPTVQELRTRAEQLHSEQSFADGLPPASAGRVVKTPMDAALKALEDMGLGLD